MDLFMYAFSLMLVMVTIGNSDKLCSKTIKNNFVIAIGLIVTTVILVWSLARTSTKEMHDVTACYATTFAEPKTITVTTTTYPSWSIHQDDIEWQVKDQK